MIAPACDCTFAIAPLMLDVVSATKITSGFGGIAGVCTTFGIVMLPPGFSVAETDGGSTPGVVARAVAAATPARSMTRTRQPRLETSRGRRVAACIAPSFQVGGLG